MYQGTGPRSSLEMTAGGEHLLAVFRHVMGRYRADTARLLSDISWERTRTNCHKLYERNPS